MSNLQNAEEVAGLNRRNGELLQELEQKKFEVNELQQRLDGRSHEIARLNGTLQERNGQIEWLRTQLDRTTRDLQTEQTSHKDLSDRLADERKSARENVNTLQQDHNSELARIKAVNDSERKQRAAKHVAELKRQLEKREDKWRVEFATAAKTIRSRFSESEAAVGLAIESLDSRVTTLKSITGPVIAAKKSLDTLRVRATEQTTEIEDLKSRLEAQEKQLRDRMDTLTARLSLTTRERDDAKGEANEREDEFRNVKKDNERLRKELKVFLYRQPS